MALDDVHVGFMCLAAPGMFWHSSLVFFIKRPCDHELTGMIAVRQIERYIRQEGEPRRQLGIFFNWLFDCVSLHLYH